jgi:hypothetical protein
VGADSGIGVTGILSTGIIVVAFAKDHLVEVLALVVTTDVLGAFVRHEACGNCVGAGYHFCRGQVDAVTTIVTGLAAFGRWRLSDDTATGLGTVPVATIAQGSPLADRVEVIPRPTTAVGAAAGSAIAGIGGDTRSALAKATVVATFFVLAIGGTLTLVGLARKGGLALAAGATTAVVAALLAGTGRNTQAETVLADILVALALAADAPAAIGPALYPLAGRAADLSHPLIGFRHPVRRWEVGPRPEIGAGTVLGQVTVVWGALVARIFAPDQEP